MPRRATWICLASLVFVAACTPAWKNRPTPFATPRDAFYPSLKVIAVTPIVLPRDVDDPETVRVKFHRLIEERLKDEGFQVVPAAELAPVVEAAIAERGGIFDPITGQVDKAKLEAVEAVVRRAAREQLHADAILEPGIVVRSAGVRLKEAEWDGALQNVWTGSVWSSKLWKGTVPALSVGVWLKRPDGTLLYRKAGGLQVLSKIGKEGEMVLVPRAELFADEIRNWQAVHLALDELFGKKAVGSLNQ